MEIEIEIDLPLHQGKPPLSLNQRLHWAEKARRSRRIRESVYWQAKALRLGTVDHVTVQLHYAAPVLRQRDPDNLIPSQKPAVDGLVDARLIPGDTPQHLSWSMPLIHPGANKPRLWLTLEVS